MLVELRNDWQVILDGAPIELTLNDDSILPRLLDRGVLRQRPAVTVTPEGFRYSFIVGWDKLGQLGQTVTRLVKTNQELREKLNILTFLSAEIKLPDEQRKLLEEALSQLGVRWVNKEE